MAARGAGQRPPATLVVPAVGAALLALLPLGYLVVRAGDKGAGFAFDYLRRDSTSELVLRSLGLTVTVTVACVVLGVGLAVVTTRIVLPGRALWMTLAALPLAIPSYVSAYAWISALPSLAGFGGAALVLTACTYPYVYLPAAAALSRTDPALEEVARSLGRTPWQTFRTVTLRQIRPAVASGALLVALYVLSDFGAVSLMRFDAFTQVIYTSYRASFDRTPAAVLSLVLVVITIAITLGEVRSRGRAQQWRAGAGAARRPVPQALSRGRTLATLGGCVAVALVSLGVPLASLGYWIVRGASLDLDWSRLAGAGATTIVASGAGALGCVVLAVPVGVLAARYRSTGVRMIEQATFAGHALPGIVVALALIFFGTRYARPFYLEMPMVIAAYVVLFLPAAVGAVRASVALSSPRVEEVARSLGRSPYGVLRTVTLPLAAPGVAAGAALVMLTCMKELPATLLLHPTGSETLAIRLWSLTRVGSYADAAPYAAALVLLAALPTFWLSHASRQRHHTEELAP